MCLVLQFVYGAVRHSEDVRIQPPLTYILTYHYLLPPSTVVYAFIIPILLLSTTSLTTSSHYLAIEI